MGYKERSKQDLDPFRSYRDWSVGCFNISLVSKDDKDRVFGVLFILGWLGDIILYFIEKDKDRYLSSMALYLFIGEIIMFVIVFPLFLLTTFI